MKYLFLITIFMSNMALANEFFYKRCSRNSSGQEDCQVIQAVPYMKYKRLDLKDLRVGSCYKKVKGNKIVFFKINQIKNRTIFALAQVVKVSNVRDFGNKVFVDNFPWNGDNFNDQLIDFPCSETPMLGDLEALKKECKYRVGETKRRTLYCNPRIKVRTNERKF